MSKLAWVATGVAVLVVTAAVVLGGWAVGWWFRTQNTNREAHLYLHSYGAQVGNIQTIQNDMNGIDNITVEMTQVSSDTYIALRGQKRNLTQDACDHIAQVPQSNWPTNVAKFAAANC